MSDPAIPFRQGQHFAIRFLLSELWERVIMLDPDPQGLADQTAANHLDAIESVLAKNSESLLTHTALQEIEDFWSGVRNGVRARLSAQGGEAQLPD